VEQLRRLAADADGARAGGAGPAADGGYAAGYDSDAASVYSLPPTPRAGPQPSAAFWPSAPLPSPSLTESPPAAAGAGAGAGVGAPCLAALRIDLSGQAQQEGAGAGVVA
jgi:hypothetical protein